MKIIIAGAGAVGTHLAKLFCREHHDIILIDANSKKLEDVDSNFDLLTLAADPSSIDTLHKAEVKHADLFVAVTPIESENLILCMLASKLGAKQTIARVDNYDYTHPENEHLFKETGVNHLIYPEDMAGKEIARCVLRSWTRQWIPIQNERLLLIAVKLRKGAPLLNQPLREVSKPESPYHVLAVKRRDDIHIPHGDDNLIADDLVYFMTTPQEVSTLKEITGKEDYPDVQSIFIFGGGAVTARTLQALPSYLHIKVFESDPEIIEQLQNECDNDHVLFINDDGRNLDLLVEEGIEHVEAFVGATESSSTNVLSCLNAKKLGVRKTVALINNPNYLSMAQTLDIGTIIDKKNLAADKIYQRILKADVTNLKSLVIANADVCEVVVRPSSKVTKHKVRDLHIPQSITLGGMVRKGKGALINGDTQLIEGDTVVAVCIDGSVKKLERFFH